MAAADIVRLAAIALSAVCVACVPATKAPAEITTVTIGGSGALTVNGKATTLDRLQHDVCAEVGSGEPACLQGHIRVQGKGEPTYAEFMAVMNQLQNSGFLGVAVVGEDAG